MTGNVVLGLWPGTDASPCPWCRQPTAGGDPTCPACGHRRDVIPADCDCAACRATDAGFLVFERSRGRFIHDIDRLTGRVTYTADSAAARVFRSDPWRRVWDRPGVERVELAAQPGGTL